MSDDFMPPPSASPKSIIPPEPPASSNPSQPTSPTPPPPPSPKPPTPSAPTPPPATPAGPPTPPPDAPQLQPDPPVPPENPPRKTRQLVVSIILIFAIAAVIGLGAYAYFSDWNPFQKPLPPEEVIGKMFMQIPQITSAKQQADISFASQPRDPDALGLDQAVPNLYAHAQQLKRDQDRVNNLRYLQSTLSRAYVETGAYPLNLDATKDFLIFSNDDILVDPNTKQPYGYRQEAGGANFILHIPFETEEAISALRQAYADENKEVVIRDVTTVEISAQSPQVYADVTSDNFSLLALSLSDQLYQFLPAEIAASLTYGSQNQIGEDLQGDGETNIAGSLSLGDISFQLGLDVRKKAKTYFTRITKAPSLGFFDLAAIKNQWIRISLDEINNPDLQESLNQASDQLDEQNKSLLEQYTIAVNLLQSTNLIEVSQELPMWEDESGKYYQYNLRLVPENVANYYRQLSQQLEDQFGDKALVKYQEKADEYFSSSEFIQIMTATNDNTNVQLSIDSKDFWPRQLKVTSRMVPPAAVTKAANKQYRLTYNFDLTNINQPISIQEPDQSITWQKAYELVTGQTIAEDDDSALGSIAAFLPGLSDARSKANTARIKSNLGQLRTIAEIYYDSQGASYAGLDQCLTAPTAATCGTPELAANIAALNQDSQEAYGGSKSNLVVHASPTAFCISHPLLTGQSSCLDSQGQSSNSICNPDTISCSK